MTEINREHFEAWLFAQPDDRPYVYGEGFPNDPVGCIVCNYLREQTNEKDFVVGGSQQGIAKIEQVTPFPRWLAEVLWRCASLTTFGAAKKVYTKLHGNPTFGSSVPASQEQTQNTKVPETPVLESITQ